MGFEQFIKPAHLEHGRLENHPDYVRLFEGYVISRNNNAGEDNAWMFGEVFDVESEELRGIYGMTEQELLAHMDKDLRSRLVPTGQLHQGYGVYPVYTLPGDDEDHFFFGDDQWIWRERWAHLEICPL